MNRGPLTPPPPPRRQLVAPHDRRNWRFRQRLAQRRATWVYEPRDPFWCWEQQMRALGGDDA